MIRRLLTGLCALLATLATLLALALVAPNPLVEFLAGIVGGSVLLGQIALVALAAALLAVLRWLDRPQPRWSRATSRALAVLMLVTAGATAWRELAHYSRKTTQVSVDGAMHEGTLYRPRGGDDDPRPAVVIVHGSGDSKRSGYHFLARRFAERGFIVLNVDKRGVGGSPGEYYGDDLADSSVIALRATETRSALGALATVPGVDPTRVGLVTISQGGWVIASLLDGSSPARYATNLSGPAVSTGEEGVWSAWAYEDGDHFGIKPPPEPYEVLDQRIALVTPRGYDPRLALQSMTLPSLWLYGEWDSSIPTRASTRVLDSLASRGRPVTWRIFPEANHGLFVVRGPNARRLAQWAPGVWDTVFAWTARQGITPPSP